MNDESLLRGLVPPADPGSTFRPPRFPLLDWLSGWLPFLPDTRRRCPFCDEPIRDLAVVCRWCGQKLGDAEEPE